MNGLAGQAITLLFGRGVIRVAQFVAFLILARLLSPTEFGWFGILTTGISLAAMLGSLGLRQSFTYEIGQGRLTPGRAAGTALVAWPVLTLASGAVIIGLYGKQIEGIPATVASVIIFLGVAGAMLHTLMQGVFLGKGVIWAFSLSEALPRIMLMLGVIALALTTSMTLTNAMWVQVGSFLLALPVIVFLAVRGAGRIATAFRRIGPMLGYGLIFAFNLFLVTFCSRLSMFIIESLSGAAAAGQFFAAVRVSEIFLEAATALGLVLFANAARSDDSASSIKRSVKIASWLFWFFMILAILVALLAPFVITFLLGDAYAGAAPALQILALSMAPAAASKIVYSALAGTGRPFFGTPVLLVSLALNAALAFLLIPALGVIGGAIALVIGQYALLIGYAITCRLRFGIPLQALFVPQWRDIKNLRAIVSRR